MQLINIKLESLIISILVIPLCISCSQVADTNNAVQEAELKSIGAELEQAKPVEFEESNAPSQ
jgi:cytochrome c556